MSTLKSTETIDGIINRLRSVSRCDTSEKSNAGCVIREGAKANLLDAADALQRDDLDDREFDFYCHIIDATVTYMQNKRYGY